MFESQSLEDKDTEIKFLVVVKNL